MNILVDCTNQKVGGGIQVATSFINDLKELDLPHQFIVVLSRQMVNNFDRSKFPSNIKILDLPQGVDNKMAISKYLLGIEKEYKIDKVFCVFGPSYYKSMVPKVVGYALPHFIYKDSPYFKKISLKASIRLFFLEKIQVYLFKKNSDALVFETEDAANKFKNNFNYRRSTYVVSNTLNEIFTKPELWKRTKVKTDPNTYKILCLGANYPHKNIAILPAVIDSLLKNNFKNFKFYISLEKSDLNFEEKYNQYIHYMGKIDLMELPELYKSIDVVFMPTLLEVFSATYLEAMHMERPIVASNMSFARDICQDSAVYFNPVSAESAAEQLLKVYQDESLKAELLERAKVNIQRFGNSMDRTKKYLNIILK